MQSSIGVSIITLTPQLAEFFDVTDGVLITEVLENSQSFKNGIRAGDIIKFVENLPIKSRTDFENAMNTLSVDEKCNINVYRDGKEMNISTIVFASKPKLRFYFETDVDYEKFYYGNNEEELNKIDVSEFKKDVKNKLNTTLKFLEKKMKDLQGDIK